MKIRRVLFSVSAGNRADGPADFESRRNIGWMLLVYIM